MVKLIRIRYIYKVIYLWIMMIYVYRRAIVDGQTAVIRHRQSGKLYRMTDALAQVAATSAIDCVETCTHTPGCQGSMLHANRCVLYRRASCACSIENTVALDNNLPSRYKIVIADEAMGMHEARTMCEKQGMHLLAVNSQQEQEAVVQYLNQTRTPMGYIGCFGDTMDRAMKVGPEIMPSMTTSMCKEFCVDMEMPYYGTQNREECFCGESFDKYGKAENCNARCAGNQSEICGGDFALSVYGVGKPRCEVVWTGGWIKGTEWKWLMSPSVYRPLMYDNWASGQPTTQQGEQCLVLQEQSSYAWHAMDCAPRPNTCYVCECDAKDAH